MFRHHSLPINSCVGELVELQVKIKLTNGALWYDLIAMHQGLSVRPNEENKKNEISITVNNAITEVLFIFLYL